jgi:hypothetical protein
MSEAYGVQIGFGEWMLVGVPLVLVMLPICWLLLTRVLFRIRSEQIAGGDAVIQAEIRSLGSLSRTVPIAGGGLILLYAIGLARFGAFHMLDYLLYAGAGYYLLVSNSRDPRVRGTGIPALFLTVGFSLCWVALEKIVYPQWGLYVLEQNPQLALGLDLRFFLLAAAFVEFSLGYLLIIGLLERPLALTITLVFFTTTLVFGKLEVIGHTLIHGALIVFLLEGPGSVYKPPVRIHERIGLRAAFASVNFVLLLAILLVPYVRGAMRLHHAHTQANVAGLAAPG